MNRKFFSGFLACALAVSSLFGITACKPAEPDKGGLGNGGNNGNVVKPGTVITDAKVKDELVGSLTETAIGGFVFSGSVAMNLTGGETAGSQTISVEGAVKISETGAEGDFDVAINGVSGDDKVSQYALYFLRDGVGYSAAGDWDKQGEIDFSALKESLKAEDPLVLSRDTFDEYASLLRNPAALVKVAKNLSSLGEGVVTKTEGGYSVEFDLWATAGDILDDVAGLAEAIDKNKQMTVSGLLGQSAVSGLLGKLFKGVTGKELYDTAKPLLPEGIADALPEPGAKATAVEYLESCLRSGAFYTAIAGDEDPWSEFTTFAEVPLDTILGALSGGEVTLEGLNLKEMFDNFRDGLEESLVSALFSLLSPGEGTFASEEIRFVVGFSFDENKKLLGFAADARLVGTKTPAAAQDPEQTMREAGNPERGTVSLKLEATCSSSPALFDLAGSKYYAEEGGTATVPGKK